MQCLLRVHTLTAKSSPAESSIRSTLFQIVCRQVVMLLFIAIAWTLFSSGSLAKIVDVQLSPWVSPTPSPVDISVGDTVRITSDHPSLFVPCVWGAADIWAVRVDSGVFGDAWVSPQYPLGVRTILTPPVVQWSSPSSFRVDYFYLPPSGFDFCPGTSGCIRVLDSTGTCCAGTRGNIELTCDNSAVDISDLTSLIAYMFKASPPPICLPEADVDANSDLDIADVTYLVGYMFKGGPAPMPCPVVSR